MLRRVLLRGYMPRGMPSGWQQRLGNVRNKSMQEPLSGLAEANGFVSDPTVVGQEGKIPSFLSKQHAELIKNLRTIPEKVNEVQRKAEAEPEIYGREAWLAENESGLYLRQLKIEEEQIEDAVQSYAENMKQLLELGKATNMKFVQRMLLEWYEPMALSLQDELSDIRNKVPAQDRTVYGPCLLLLPVEKLSIITLNTVLNSILKVGNRGVSVSSLSFQVGSLIETEVNINKLRLGSGKLKKWQSEIIAEAYKNSRASRGIGQRVRVLLGDEPWDRSVKHKIGAVLISKMIESAKFRNRNALVHSIPFMNSIGYKKLGLLHLDEEAFKNLAEREMTTMLPRYLPMLVPPKDWNNRNLKNSCYFRLHAPLVRTHNRTQLDAVRRADMGGVLEGLDFLGSVPWRINPVVMDVFRQSLSEGITVGEILSNENMQEPSPESCYRLPSQIEEYQKTRAQMFARREEKERKKQEKKNRLQKGKKQSYSVSETSKENDNDLSNLVGLSQDDGKSINDEVDEVETKSESSLKSDIDIDENTLDEIIDPDTPIFDNVLYNEMCRRVKRKNAELHSLRCDTQLKYWVAEKFKDDNMYYPTNLDFRGRAYPVPPNLSHLGSDLCRGLLTFAEKKPLGDQGLFWLKCHLCNLFGNNKISFADRSSWAEDHLEDIIDSAKNPLDGERWWNTAEEPFQALAACVEIVNALECDDPSEYMSSLPIHQDGSCNGLQHYAALGHDSQGGNAVNLTPNDSPQDVYSEVLDIVHERMSHDVNIPEEVGIYYFDLQKEKKYGADVYDKMDKLTTEEDVVAGKAARMVKDVVDRKVIKQTVMTSVYGVTRIGARAQVQARLEEKLANHGEVTTPELDKEIFASARYIANLTLNSLEEMFSGAKEIMDWLATCAHLVAQQGHPMAWVSPMGLPVMQPYRQYASQTIKTTMQNITLSIEDEALPISTMKQRSAFPPNYVHSLDATHMLMTALRMKDLGMTFASVHDSYWTHACDVPAMSDLIRECFVELYSQPVLEDLRESLVMRYPDIDFPPVPKGGDLDLNEVRDSKYFFH